MRLGLPFDRLKENLQSFSKKGLRRRLSLAEGVDFSSNDYLGHASHSEIKRTMIAALADPSPMGSGGSRLLRGNHLEHERLEMFAASLFGFERALFFQSGFDANHAVFSALPSRHDWILYDEYIHASVKEGARASPAKTTAFKHNDLTSLKEKLSFARSQGAVSIWVAVESLYSMDGDFCPLAEFSAVLLQEDVVFVVDEAHAVGVFGSAGLGLFTTECKNLKNSLVVYPCGKAVGLSGALVCGPEAVVETLIQSARSFIYTTAPMPVVAAAVRRSLELFSEEESLRKQLYDRVQFARNLLSKNLEKWVVGGDPLSQIVPLIIGSEEQSVQVARLLQDAGQDVRAVRTPTVPEGQARLRLSLHAQRTEEEISVLVELLAKFERSLA